MTSSQSEFTPDPLDELIGAALRARPEPAAPFDLAARAIALAPLVLEPLARLQRILHVVTAVAAVAITGLVLFVGYRFTQSTSPVAATSDDSTYYVTTLSTPALIVALAILAVPVAIALSRVLASDRPSRVPALA